MRTQEETSSKSIAKEACVLKNNLLRLEVLPALGGKLSSLTLQPGGGELLQAPLKPYAPRTPGLPFDQADGSGWDECLPSIGPCTVPSGSGAGAQIEDHGDFWGRPFSVDEQTTTTLRMHARGTSLPLHFERTLRLEGPVLHLGYSLRNTGASAVPYGWSVHPLFAIEPGDRIHLPASVKQVVAQSSADGRLSPPGSSQPWPLTTNARDAQRLDLALAGSPEDGVGDKLVLAAPVEGWCALERRTLRTRLTLRFDPKQWPWLGLWLCYGGWPQGNGKKGYTVALEPCNLPDDSLAASLTQGGGAHLEPGATAQWSLQLAISDAEER